VRVSTRQSVRTTVINASNRLFYSQFGATADDTIYTLVLFLRPAIPWKCELVMSRNDCLLSRVLLVLISCVCLGREGGGGFRAKDTSTVVCTGLVV
jgi:hypothetical protein